MVFPGLPSSKKGKERGEIETVRNALTLTGEGGKSPSPVFSREPVPEMSIREVLSFPATEQDKQGDKRA